MAEIISTLENPVVTFDDIKKNLKIHYCEMDWERFEEIKSVLVNNTATSKKTKEVRIEFKFHRVYLWTYLNGGKSYLEVEVFPCNQHTKCPHRIYTEKDIRNLVYNEFMEMLYNDVANTLYWSMRQKHITQQQAMSLTYNYNEKYDCVERKIKEVPYLEEEDLSEAFPPKG